MSEIIDIHKAEFKKSALDAYIEACALPLRNMESMRIPMALCGYSSIRSYPIWKDRRFPYFLRVCIPGGGL